MKIDLVPFCGLGNRLNVLCTALAVQKVSKHEITVYWDKTSDCFAWFDELFMPIGNLEIKRLSKFYMKSPGKDQLWLPRLLRTMVYKKRFKAKNLVKTDELLKWEDSDERIFIEGNRPFSSACETSMLADYFKPIAVVQDKIDALTSQYKPFTIGVHVRRTDHKDVIKNNPLEGYLSAMEAQLVQHPEACFYLASDDAEVKREFTQRFPGKIITADNNLSRNAVEGMQDAVVELFALGRCNILIGSKGSTFSELAAKLYNTPVVYP